MAEKRAKTPDALLSFFLNNAPRDRIPSNALPQSLHPFAASPPDELLPLLHNLVDASAAISRNLQTYSSLTVTDHKFVSILRQSTTLIEGLHTSHQETQERVEALRSRTSAGSSSVYGEPIPLDDSAIVDWCISRIEDWSRKSGMEVFREEDNGSGKMIITLAGKVLVIDVDLAIRRDTNGPVRQGITVSNVKTSHALPTGNSGNALAERSGSLDAFILRTWNDYLDEVQKAGANSSMRAAQMSRDIQSHLSYLMKLDSLASREGDQGIRWFNDTGLMNAVTDKVSKTEVEALSTILKLATINLDIFLSRAHALAIPYLTSPSMSFLVYLSPLAYYSLLRASTETRMSSIDSRQGILDAFMRLDIPLSVLQGLLTQRHSRPPGTVIATLALTSVAGTFPLYRRSEQQPNFGRPQFRLPGTSSLDTVDYALLGPSSLPITSSEVIKNVWMLDFTEGGQSPGIIMTHSRMRDIQQVIDPQRLTGGAGFTMHMQMPPLPGNWISLLIDPTLPPSARYIATYKSPTNTHPPLRLRLSVPNEAGFLLQQVPVTSLKEIYGVLEIVRDQCWINETLKTVNWVAEDLMPAEEDEDERDDVDATGAPEKDLEALLKGIYAPRLVPVNVFLPIHPPSFSSINSDGANDLDSDNAEHPVPGLSSVSVSFGESASPPCIALAFAVHQPAPKDLHHAGGPRHVALILRHDRSRKRGLRININVGGSDATGLGDATGERPSPGLIEELEEFSRRGSTFGIVGKVWSWLTRNAQ